MGDGDGEVVYRDADVAVYDRVEPPTRPIDRVRWGAILAGLVTALSTLVLLSVLGLAVGLSAYDPGDQLGNFGMGASIWGIISTITAFILGGWVAARSAAVGGRSNALLNGIMVWAVTIPLILYMIGSGVGSVLNMATDVAAAGASAVTDAVNPADASAAADAAQAQAQQVDPATIQAATENASGSAWGTLVALLLGLAAAAIGGVLGKHDRMASHRVA
jgi:ABC-type transport system involved in multi-copper enzyme maturation permease subunit